MIPCESFPLRDRVEVMIIVPAPERFVGNHGCGRITICELSARDNAAQSHDDGCGRARTRILRLGDALALTLLILERDPARLSPAAARWAARFVLEVTPAPTLAELQLIAAALAGLPSITARRYMASRPVLS